MRSTIVTRVVGAELRRAGAVGGVRRGVITCLVISLLAGVGMTIVARTPSLQETLGLRVADIGGSATLAALMVVTVMTSNYVTRDIDQGVMAGAKLWVPWTMELFFGRLLAWGVLTVCVSLLPALVCAVIARVAGVSGQGIVMDLVAILVASAATSAAGLLVYLGALILRKGAYVVTASLFLLVILPLIFAAISALVPPITDAARAASAALIGTLLIQAVTLPGTVDSATGSSFAGAWIGLALWLVAAGFLAYKSFAQESYGSR